jgi:hypothetical protein
MCLGGDARLCEKEEAHEARRVFRPDGGGVDHFSSRSRSALVSCLSPAQRNVPRGSDGPGLLCEAPFTDFDRNGIEGVFDQADNSP